jgi:hypothetical protein
MKKNRVRLQEMQELGSGGGDKEVDLGEEKGLLVPRFTRILY